MKRRNFNDRIQIVWLGERSPTKERRAINLGLPDINDLREQIKLATTQLQTAIARYDISKLLPLIVILNMARSAGTPKRSVDPDSPAFKEYLTALALKTKKPGSLRPSIRNAVKIRDLAERAFWHCSEYCSAQLFNSEQVDEDAWTILTNARMHYMLVRGETYDRFFLDAACRLFTSQSGILENKFGFNIEQAVSFIKVIFKIINARFENEKERLSLIFRELASTESSTSTWPVGARYKKQVDESIPILTNLPELARDLYTISEEELLRSISSKDQESMLSFLKWISIEQGEVDSNFSSPLDENPIQRTPTIKLGSSYLFHTSNYLGRCLFYSIDKELKKDASYKEKYNRIRALYLEQESLGVFKKIFPAATAYHRLKYVIYEKNRSFETELDGLVQHDNNIFLIECATHPVTRASKRGAKEPIIHDIKQSIERTFKQARRAKEYIQTNDQAQFTMSDGSSIIVDNKSVKNYFLISVTFDSFDILAADPRKLKSLGLFPENEYPWPIYIESLKMISDFIDFPSQFVHYLKKRMAVSEKVYASDELDYFGCYLISNLEIPMPNADHPIEKVLIVNATSDFDQYFYYKRGMRPKVPRPGQFIPKHLRSILRALEKAHTPGYTEISCSLLDISYAFRGAIEENIISALYRSNDSGGMLKDCTVVDTHNQWGFTYFCGDGTQTSNLQRMLLLPEFCMHKMNEIGIYTWVGILCDTSIRKPFVGVFYSSDKTLDSQDDKVCNP
jgi:hypothetical protein